MTERGGLFTHSQRGVLVSGPRPQLWAQPGLCGATAASVSYRTCRGILSRRNVHIKFTLTHLHNHVNPHETEQCDSSFNTESLLFCRIRAEDHYKWSCMLDGTERDWTPVVTKTLVSVNIPVL